MHNAKKTWRTPTIKNELPVNETLGCCDAGEDACGWRTPLTLMNPVTGVTSQVCPGGGAEVEACPSASAPIPACG